MVPRSPQARDSDCSLPEAEDQGQRERAADHPDIILARYKNELINISSHNKVRTLFNQHCNLEKMP